ncbi:unnamed protein product [Rhizoctonia solani]|uniref:Transmembrane protein n=1 Tax=Rhizoctonia solani TaxID=456999 RepID=A0A8H3AB29_9AGAM|nr:unnamed protein product [Rhizoctonia solani]
MTIQIHIITHTLTFEIDLQEGILVVWLWCHSTTSNYLHNFDYSLLGFVQSKMGSMVGWPLHPIRACGLSALRLLIPGLIVTVGHGILQTTINIKKATVVANPFPELFQGCIISIPNSIWLAYFSGVLYELLVFSLIVWRVWQLGDGLSLTPLLKQLLTNGAWYFAVNLGLMLFSCVGAAYPATIIMANASGLLTALSSIMCSRIFFSMHEFAREDRVRVSPGLPLTTGARGGANISCQFAIPMETFNDGARSPSTPGATLAAPTQSLSQSVA